VRRGVGIHVQESDDAVQDGGRGIAKCKTYLLPSERLVLRSDLDSIAPDAYKVGLSQGRLRPTLRLEVWKHASFALGDSFA